MKIVIACSALKRRYRDRLRELAGPLRIFVLAVERDVLTERMKSREHFMPASLLDSQLATLEFGEDVAVVDASPPADEVAAGIAEAR